MPLVISKSGAVQHVPSEESLAEILGHSNFDGEDWAIGDRIIFEDGTQSRIKQEPGEQFHVWDDPTAADFEEVKQATGASSATDWPELFRTVEISGLQQGLRRVFRALPWQVGCLGILCVGLLFGLSFLMRISVWMAAVAVGVSVLLVAACASDIFYYRAKIRAAEQRNREGDTTKSDAESGRRQSL